MDVSQDERESCTWPLLSHVGGGSLWASSLCMALDRIALVGEQVWRLGAWLCCAADAFFEKVFALGQPWAVLRFLFLLGYLYWALIRPYALYPKSMPDVLPFPYMLLPKVPFFVGLHKMFEGMELWFVYLFRWDVVRYWILWMGSFVLAWLAAAFYLWRIFDLEADPKRRDLRRRQSRWMVLYRAFAPLYIKRFRVLDGRVDSDASAIYWFGGPGFVQVAMDNAVVLERTGQSKPRVVPPEPKWQTMKGYERVRRILDLRDQHLRFDVALRTRDGVPLVFHDVRLVYSIQREKQDATLQEPYPCALEGVEHLVRSEGGMARDLNGDLPWENEAELRRWRSVEHAAKEMRVAFQSRLRRAVSAHTLPEVLAFIQKGEAGGIVRQWNVQLLSVRQSKRLSLGPLPPYGPLPQAPADPLPRYCLTALLRKPGYEPQGVSLHWADMNDWDVTVENIKPQFIQAWQLSWENRRRAASGVLSQVRQDAYLAFLDAEIQRWDQMLSRGDLRTPEGGKAFLVGVREWLARLWALLQEIEDRQIGLDEAESLHRA